MLFRARLSWLTPVIFAILPCALSAQPARHTGFTLEQALSAPFNSDLVASPAGGRFAWVANDEGKRNVWIAEPAGGSYTARQVTRYTADDGEDIGEVRWSADGESLAYVRGGDLEFTEKPEPNPALLPGGIEQDVWVLSVQGGEPRKIGPGREPAFSPKGDQLAYIVKGQIWMISLADASAKPEQILHTRGSAGSLRWSPDGKYLAFVSNRGDHGLVGVYAVGTKTLSYLDPGTDHDQEPAWSPDSTHVAFLRIPFSKEDAYFQPVRTAEPWSIRVADVATGKGHEVWMASEGQGSAFHEVVAQDQIQWGAGDRIVFPWEADGWTHLYSVPVSGGKASLLTPGAFEVEDVSLSPDRQTIVYSSNQDDIDRRHVWRVAVEGGAPTAATRGEGIEMHPVLASDNKTLAVLRSDARVTIHPALVKADGQMADLAPQAIPKDFPASQFVVPQQVIFPAADGLEIHGQLFLPPDIHDGRKHPALVFFHGGSRRQMLLGWHYMLYYSNAYGMNQYLASKGYIVLAVNYRSGIGYGLNFREALNYGADGASEFNDVQGAGLYLRSRADVDARHIGAWGGSYGGYLTAMALARASDMFAAGVDMHGVHDWNLELGNWLPAYDPAAHPNAARLAWESSPTASVSTWRSPVLLIQGDDDRNVQFSQTVQLAEALRKQKVDFEELIFPDEIHDFLLHRSWLAAYHAEENFFDRKLKGLGTE